MATKRIQCPVCSFVGADDWDKSDHNLDFRIGGPINATEEEEPFATVIWRVSLLENPRLVE